MLVQWSVLMSTFLYIGVHSDHFYKDLIAKQFALNSKSFVEINSIKSLININQNTNEFYDKQNKSQINVKYLQRKRISFVVNTLKRIIDLVGFHNFSYHGSFYYFNYNYFSCDYKSMKTKGIFCLVQY